MFFFWFYILTCTHSNDWAIILFSTSLLSFRTSFLLFRLRLLVRYYFPSNLTFFFCLFVSCTYAAVYIHLACRICINAKPCTCVMRLCWCVCVRCLRWAHETCETMKQIHSPFWLRLYSVWHSGTKNKKQEPNVAECMDRRSVVLVCRFARFRFSSRRCIEQISWIFQHSREQFTK